MGIEYTAISFLDLTMLLWVYYAVKCNLWLWCRTVFRCVHLSLALVFLSYFYIYFFFFSVSIFCLLLSSLFQTDISFFSVYLIFFSIFHSSRLHLHNIHNVIHLTSCVNVFCHMCVTSSFCFLLLLFILYDFIYVYLLYIENYKR